MTPETDILSALQPQEAPPEQSGMERTKDDPQQGKGSDPNNLGGLTDEKAKKVVALVRKFKQGWFLRRRMIIKRCLKSHEFFKGNQFISFDPENFQWFDSLEAAFSNQNKEQDLNLYQFVNNIYQMLAVGFVGALSPQVPKSRFLPENAEKEADIATAKASSTLQEIIERQNNIRSLHKQGLLYLWMTGCYFRHTRYLVDADRAGTHEEPIQELAVGEILPARYVCYQCGATTPANNLSFMTQAQCAGCGSPLSDENFYPPEQGEMPTIAGYKDVANGMVAQTLYSPMNVDCDPEAKNLRETPLLNLDQEMSLAALRAMFPDMWEQFQQAQGPTTPEGQNERYARAMIYSESGGRANFMQDERPTYSRTWLQPWAYFGLDDKELAGELKQLFPDGLLLMNVGDVVCSVQKAKLTDEWSWAGTVEETFGLFPPAVGDVVIPFQERVNDCANLTHEYMDRLSGGIILGNENIISSGALSGKPLLSGVINPVKPKRILPGDNLQNAFAHFKFEQDPNLYQYEEKLIFTAQMISGVTPQVYGGSGDPHIETMGGQQQQLQTAMGKLALYWDNVREENARAAEIAVKCAAANITDDLFDVVTDQTKEYRNKYVRLDDMQGNVHAYPETDQGFPVSYQELMNRWEQLIEAAEKNPIVQELFEDPTNQEQAVITMGVPGMVIPGRAMRSKVLRVIDQLVDGQTIPSTQQTPMGPVAIELPSVLPDNDFDDLEVAAKVVREWAVEHYDLADDNPKGFENVKAYYRTILEMAKKQAMENAPQQAPPQNPQQQQVQ